GQTRDGQLATLDVPYFTSSDEPPPLLRFESSRWRHLLAGLTSVGWPPGSVQARTQQRAREALASWLCRRGNAAHPHAPRPPLYLFFFRHALGQKAPVERTLVAQGACDGG